MPAWIESELKLGLPDVHAWEWVRERLGPGETREQVNHFFDRTDGALSRLRIGVRIRSEGGRDTLAVKSASISDPADPGTTRIELEAILEDGILPETLARGLDLEPWIARWRDGDSSVAGASREALERSRLLESLSELTRDHRLHRIGGFVNRREIFQMHLDDPEGRLEFQLELDRTELPGERVDYEIEVEETNERDGRMIRTHRALTRWLEQEAGISTFPVDSKLARLQALLDGVGGSP